MPSLNFIHTFIPILAFSILHIHFISIWIYTDWITYIITIFCQHLNGSSISCIANCFGGFWFQRCFPSLDRLSNFSWLIVVYPIFGYVSQLICDFLFGYKCFFFKLVLLCSISFSGWNNAFVPFRCFRFLPKYLPPRVSTMYYRGVPCFLTTFPGVNWLLCSIITVSLFLSYFNGFPLRLLK